MSGDAQTELHDAVLKALTAALKPVPMFERVPQDQAFPYAAIGDGEVEEWDTTTELGQEHRVMLHVFSRKRGKQECRELLKKIYDALHNQPLTLASGAALVYIYYEFSGITEDPDGKTYHGVARYRAVTTEVGTGPAAFTFADQTDVAVSGTATSEPVVLAGITGTVVMTVTGGETSVNGGAFSNADKEVVNGDSVRARHTSSASYSTAVNTVVTINGVSDTFTSMTGVQITWNPLDKGASLVLSNGNLSAIVTVSTAYAVRALTGKATGKWYYEVVCEVVDGGHTYIGIATNTTSLSVPGGVGVVGFFQESVGWSVGYVSPYIYKNGVFYTGYGGQVVAGDVVGVGYDADTDVLTFYKNGMSQGASPATQPGTIFPAISHAASNRSTARFSSAAIQYLPAGYSPWES